MHVMAGVCGGGGGGSVRGRGACVVGGMCGGEACMAEGMHGRGCAWQGGVHGGGACMADTTRHRQ